MATNQFPTVPKFVPIDTSDNKSSQGTRFSLVSYNILAQVYVKSSYFPRSPPACLKLKARTSAVLSVLKSIGADFFCLQELDEFESIYKPSLEDCGYSCLYVQRSGTKKDGCGIVFNPNRAESLAVETIQFNDLANAVKNSSSCSHEDLRSTRDLDNPKVRLTRDCVGIMAAFKLESCPSEILIVATAHLYWDPALADVKLAQAEYLVERLREFNRTVEERYGCAPAVVVAGDFNSTPGDRVYEYMVKESGGELRWPLRSCYGETIGEPAFTNWSLNFTGTLDYVFYSHADTLRPVSLLQLPDGDSPDVAHGLPNFAHPSGHLPIGALFEFVRTSD